MFLPRAVVADEANQGEEVVRAAGVLLHLLVDPLRYVGRQDLHQGGGRQSSHGVVLDGSSRQVSVRHKGKVVNRPAGSFMVRIMTERERERERGPLVT